MNRRRQWGFWVALLGVLVTGYVGLFASWWLRSPSSVSVQPGETVKVVEFQYSWLYVRTYPLWRPAHWFVGKVLGYEQDGLIAMEVDSRLIYVKPLHADSQH